MSDNFAGRRILQPKKDLISFLASKGVQTVTPYDYPIDVLVTKMKEGDLWRSEHWQDYEGSSDLFPNGRYGNDALNVNDITKSILSQDNQNVRLAVEQIKLHCKLKGLNYDDFISGLSHTPWERMSGINRVLSADSVIPERYHIITISPHTSYDIVEKGNVQQMTDRSWDGISIDETEGLINLYEEARSNLDSSHCYIVETMTQKNHQHNSYDHFIAQVHRGVDSQKVDFEAEEKGWSSIRFHNVRGATSSTEGEELLLTIKYPREYRFNPEMIDENASIQASEHYIPRVFSEIMFRKRKLHVFPYREDSDLRYELSCHCSRNALLKPQCSVLAYSPELWGIFGDLMRKEGLVQVNANFVSDGKVAYLNLLD